MNWLLTFLMLILVPMLVSAVFNVVFMVCLSKFIMRFEKQEWQALEDSAKQLNVTVDAVRKAINNDR